MPGRSLHAVTAYDEPFSRARPRAVATTTPAHVDVVMTCELAGTLERQRTRSDDPALEFEDNGFAASQARDLYLLPFFVQLDRSRRMSQLRRPCQDE